MICRCRLLSSTTSSSASMMLPTPAPARYSAAGAPSPPAPTISTRAASSFSCPSIPSSLSRMCRAYHSRSWPFMNRHQSDGFKPVALLPLFRGVVPGAFIFFFCLVRGLGSLCSRRFALGNRGPRPALLNRTPLEPVYGLLQLEIVGTAELEHLGFGLVTVFFGLRDALGRCH